MSIGAEFYKHSLKMNFEMVLSLSRQWLSKKRINKTAVAVVKHANVSLSTG